MASPVPIVQFDSATRLDFKGTKAVHPPIRAHVGSLVAATGLNKKHRSRARRRNILRVLLLVRIARMADATAVVGRRRRAIEKRAVMGVAPEPEINRIAPQAKNVLIQFLDPGLPVLVRMMPGHKNVRPACRPPRGETRSEERRVGKECRSRWATDLEK